MRKWIDWLVSHGLGTAYMFIITVVLAFCSMFLLVVVAFISWWERVR